MEIKVFKEKLAALELEHLFNENPGDIIKGVVDVKQTTIALGGELHADAEALLLQDGSSQEDLWGFNIFKDKSKEDRLEYSSFINIRPSQNNRSMEVQDVKLTEQIKKIVDDLI